MDPQQTLAEALSAFRSRRFEQAEALLKQVLASGQEQADALVALGMVAGASGWRKEAVDRWQEALRVDPNSAPALTWLCKSALDDGRLEEAVDYGQRAAALVPHDVELLQPLVRALLAARRFEEAERYCRRGLRLAPKDARLRLRLAEALQGLGKSMTALSEVERAVEIAPSLDNYVLRAGLELYLGRTQKALETAELARRMKDGDPRVHLAIARALTESRRLDEAEPHWLKAKIGFPSPAMVEIERARSLSYAGQFEAASSQLQEVVDRDENAAVAYQLLVSMRRMTATDRPLIERMERAAQRADLPDLMRVEFAYALGKSYEDLGEYDRAIQFFDEANRIKLSQMPLYDSERLEAFVDWQISAFHPGKPGTGAKRDLPVFVVGMLRSGTTLTEQVLSRHPSIGAAGEQTFWTERFPSVVEAKEGVRAGPEVSRLREEYAALLRSLSPQGEFIVDKNPGNVMILGVLSAIYPNARFIHVLRNPLDNALSLWTTHIRTSADFVGSRKNIVHAYRQYRRLAAHYRSLLPESMLHEIRYEELTGDPKAATKSMTDFLGLAWDETLLHPDQSNDAVRTPSFWQVRQPIHSGSVERWRHYEPWLGEFADLMDRDGAHPL